MNSQARNSFVWLWMAALLSASIGMSVQQVYCYCTGKTTISIFSAEDACHAKKPLATPTDCCSKPFKPVKKSCCEKPEPKNNGCTKKTTQRIQLHTEYEVGSSEYKKLDAPKSWALLPAFVPFSFGNTFPQSCAPEVFEHPPPPISGRIICVRHGVFRC